MKRDILKRALMELTKAILGPPGTEDARERSRRLRAPVMRGSNDVRETLKSTRHAVGRYE